MKKTLVKSKIVLEDNGKTLVLYLWVKTFLCFGYWIPHGTVASSSKFNKKVIDAINNEEAQKHLFKLIKQNTAL